MVDAMVLGGLRRCEVLGLRLEDVNAGQRRLFVAEGKGGRQRIVPVSARFFASLGSYLEHERPATARTERVFVVLKGPRRGAALSAAGVDEILDGARARAGLQRATCHQLRHTCFTRLREGGMAWRPSRPRPVTPRSSRLASTCTWPTTGWPRSTCGRRRRSKRRPLDPSRETCGERLIGAPRRRRGDGRLIPGHLVAAGMFAAHPVTSVARMFFIRIGVDGWARLPLAQQCALPLRERRVVGWLIVTGRVRPSPDYLVACRPYLGEVAAHHHRAFHARFSARSAELGFDRIVTRLQWSALGEVAAVAGVTPERLTKTTIQAGREALVAAIGRHRPDSHGPKALSAALFGAQTTLFHLGQLDAPPRKTNRDRSAERAAAWASVPTWLAATLTGYIAQTRLSLRASTMVRVEGVLREFACWLAVNAPEVGCVADLRRTHIEAYKLHLATRPSARGGGALTKTTLAEHLGALRTCFERLTEWAGDDVPARVLVFAGDLPRRDEPLPRFIDDGAFAKLLQATRVDPDPFVRLCVEFLARTGLRKSEFLDLTVDSVVQIGAAYWLHVPLGKLRNDRYIPLHPQLKDLLDEWLTHRPAGLRSRYLFPEHGQRIRQTASTGPSRRSRRRLGSAMSARIVSGIPWLPRRSTGACPWKRWLRCWDIDRCG